MTIVVSMVFINNPGVMSNNTRMVIARLFFFMTIGLGHILALLNIGNINNYFIINIAFLMLLFLWDLMALLVLLVMTMRAIMLLVLNVSMVSMASIHKGGRQKGKHEFHFVLKKTDDFPPCMNKELKYTEKHRSLVAYIFTRKVQIFFSNRRHFYNLSCLPLVKVSQYVIFLGALFSCFYITV